MNQHLYFAAIIPPEDIRRAVTDLQQDFAHRFDSSRSLKVIPHITLKAPFKVSAALHEDVLRWFLLFKTSVIPFRQELSGFGSFPNKHSPVIFIRPMMNEHIVRLQKDMIQHFLSFFPKEMVASLEYNYHPHLTIAYRDLSPEQFRIAWKEYIGKDFHASFLVENFSLLQHDSKQWNIIARHSL